MKIKPKETKAKILLHRKIAPDCFLMRLLCPEIADLARPGQFFMLRVNELHDPFLRRPFTFARILPPKGRKSRPEDEGAVEFYYKIVGRGTLLMTHLREGQRIDILGPLGNGFHEIADKSQAILIGGGIGIAPLIPWAEELRREKKQAASTLEEVIVLIGAMNKDQILGIREMKKIGFQPEVTTEDGSLGEKGMVTDLLEKKLSVFGHPSASLFACGPMPMLIRVAQIASQFDLPCQVLLESRMACGIGACLGCAVKVKDEGRSQQRRPEDFQTTGKNSSTQECEESAMGLVGEGNIPVIQEAPAFRYARVCKEGPVFDATQVLWE
jgi:dihydroorotate dehydrogenase electron transfer subunit